MSVLDEIMQDLAGVADDLEAHHNRVVPPAEAAVVAAAGTAAVPGAMGAAVATLEHEMLPAREGETMPLLLLQQRKQLTRQHEDERQNKQERERLVGQLTGEHAAGEAGGSLRTSTRSTLNPLLRILVSV
jgi:hypothetical protein